MRTEPDRLTQAAGHAVAAAIRSINTNGLFDPAITPALEAAVTLSELAMRCGATVDDIRRAGGLSTPGTAQRCAAAHPDDPSPCDGPPVVTVLDRNNAGADGCEHHAARLLASLEGGRVYGLPHAPDGAAIRVFKAAGGIRPFCWLTGAPRTEPSQLSHRENRAARNR